MAVAVAIFSAVIWGGGQLVNRQYGKALFFFLIQALFVFIELATGSINIITGQAEMHFRNAGFFLKGLWGIVTLGEIPRESSRVPVYDHSTMLMIGGLLAIVILLVFLIFYIWNIRDAYKTGKRIAQGEHEGSASYFKHVFEDSFEYIAIAPGMFLVMIFSVVPIMFSAIVVFTNYNANNIPPRFLVEWTGLQTFIDIVRLPVWSQTFVGVFIWTVIWAFVATFSNYIVGFVQAMILSSKRIRFAKFWRGLFILPWAIPGFISQLLFKNMFTTNGAFNRLLLGAGLIDKAIPFLSDVSWARFTLVIINIWLGFPYAMALISGIMTSVNQEMYEAASIDGATPFQQLRSITIPTVLSSIAPLLILSITNNFNNFGMIFFVTGGGPASANYTMAGATDILITWIYKLTVDQRMYNYAAAMSILIFLILASIAAWNLSRTRAFKED
jgi:arabinogalactan oligomer/maltooligosaccharide transport system permease protein